MSNNLVNNLKKFFDDYPRNESLRSLDSEYRYRIDAQEKFLESYKKSFQNEPLENLPNIGDKHTDVFDKLVMKLLRQSLIWHKNP